jgi:tape measure domain-containing protein
MADDEIGVRLRLKDARRFQSDARASGDSLGYIGDRADHASTRVSLLTRAGNGARTALGALGRGAIIGAKGVAGIGVATAVMGVKFNATMEQNEIAFKSFLGSSDRARKHLAKLYKLAANTPFEFPDLVMGSRRLLAFGMTARRSNGWLRTIGDTASGLGVGSEGIDKMVTAIGQIQTKGKLSTEELMQLAENGVPAFQYLSKYTGRSMDTLFKDLQDGTIKSGEALKALRKGMEKDFGGASAAQAKSLSGQFSTLQDNVRQLAGLLTTKLSKALAKDVLPYMNKVVGALSRGFKRDGFAGAVASLDRVTNAGGRVTKAVAWIRTAGERVVTAFKRWRGAGGPETALATMQDRAAPLRPMIDRIVKALKNPTVQKAGVALIGVAAAFKAVNVATGGAAGAVARFSLEGMKMGTAVVGLIANLVAFRTARMASTTAENAGTLAAIRQRVAIVAQAVATRATAVATRAAAIATRLFNLAMRMNPIGLVITALVLLVAGVVAAYKKFDWFREAVDAVWKFLKGAVVGYVKFYIAALEKIVGWVKGAPAKISSAAHGMFDGLKEAFKSALNFIIRGWNSLDFRIPEIDPPGPGPKFGGFTVGLPNIPLLARGGVLTSAGSVVVGDAGPEVLTLPRAARVDPLPAPTLSLSSAMAGGDQRPQVIELHVGREVLARHVVRAAADAKARA